MLRASTIELLLKHRPKGGLATAVYLTSFNYLLEPWINPDMSNPMAMTFNAWLGYSLMRLQEIYVVQTMGLDKDLYLPSYQVLRTASAM